MICGGHSLGGPLTAAFASWDFDGDPATRRDAGYKQCAGLVGLDTTLALGGGVGAAAPPLGGLGGAVGGAAPYVERAPAHPGDDPGPDRVRRRRLLRPRRAPT